MNSRRIQRLQQSLLAMAMGLVLAACGDSVPLEENDPPVTDRVLAYNGDPCGFGITDAVEAADACVFKVEFWDHMSNQQCVNCHDGTDQSPHFLNQSDVNNAFYQAKGVVNLADPATSTVISQIKARHYCGDQGACDALATIVEGYISSWASGGSSGGGSTTNPNEIVLEAPDEKDPGSSKTLPSDSTAFAGTNLHALLVEYCAGCHVETANIPQSPFFAASDIDAAYDALKTSQKINLDDPASSRLVVRLRDEFHNCWDGDLNFSVDGPVDCAASAQRLLEGITAFAAAVPLSTVDSNWVTSKAMLLTDGIIASGGSRDDSNAIALYQFKTGNGTTAYDTSGVQPALDLTLSGVEGIDFKWVGGWGVEFAGGKAQGATLNSRKLRDHIAATGEYSIEAWVIPGNVNQGTLNNPARIVSYSGGSMARNFTLGQAAYQYSFRNTNSTTDANGEPALVSDADDEDVQATQQHVVVTYHPTGGRTIYVNGQDTGDGNTDNLGALGIWDETYPLILGSELGGLYPWQGKLRLVAIHDRALTPDQVLDNFEAGVGEKFFLMFSISEHLSDPNCYVPDPETSNPVAQCFIMFTVSQFDDYSYLFAKPTFVALNDQVAVDGVQIQGMRLGINGKEPAVGQAYRNLDVTINKTDYETTGQVQLSDIGTTIPLEKGTDNDEFFLTFRILEGKTDSSGRPEEFVCGATTSCTKTVADGDPASDIGLRTFDEINATMSTVTTVSMQNADVLATYNTIKQQLPTVEDINTFLSAHEIAISQLAIEYCSALVDDTTKRATVFPGFNFSADANGVSDPDWSNLVITPLMNRVMGLNLATQPDTAAVTTELLKLINDPNDVRTETTVNGPVTDGQPDGLAKCGGACPAGRTELVVKATCAAILGSAVSLMQ